MASTTTSTTGRKNAPKARRVLNRSSYEVRDKTVRIIVNEIHPGDYTRIRK